MAVSLHFSSTPTEIEAFRRQASSANAQNTPGRPQPQAESADDGNSDGSTSPSRANSPGWIRWAFNGVSSVVKGFATLVFGTGQDFGTIFKASYGSGLPFLPVGSLLEAVETARARDQPLVLLVHHPQSVPSGDFCRSLLDPAVSSLLVERATLYGVFADTAEGHQVLTMIQVSRAPALVVLKVGTSAGGSPRALLVLTSLRDSGSVERLRDVLEAEGGATLTGVSRAAAAARAPAAISSPSPSSPGIPLPSQPSQAEIDRELRAEQDREYQEAVRLERERRARAEEEERQRLEREREEREEQDRLEALRQSLGQSTQVRAGEVAEYLAERSASTIRILLRLPSGVRASLSLPPAMPGRLVYQWLEGTEHLPETLRGGLSPAQAEDWSSTVRAALESSKVMEVSAQMPYRVLQRDNTSLEEQGITDGTALLVTLRD